MMGKEKPIWRLAFFSRLEERKGIKLFVDAVSALNVTDEKFEVHSLTPSRLPYMREQKAAESNCCLAMGLEARKICSCSLQKKMA